MHRRTLLKGTGLAMAAPLAAPALAQGNARTLRFVPQGNLANIDPVWTTTTLARNHGLMVYDTLFGLGKDFQPKPQMAAGHEVSADGLVHAVTLRPDLRFHDGQPVLARDCIASIARWSKRDVLGQRLAALLEEMRVKADDRFEIVLKKPWPGLTWALGKPSANICAIMPERVAQTDPFTQITDYVGSGPFRFRAAQWVPGSIAAYERFPGYVPRDEPADFLAGGKAVYFDRVEWQVMPDPATAAAALQNNEVDWWETPLADLLPVLRGNRDIAIEVVNTAGALGMIRFNHLHPPFDKPEIRRALLPAIDQVSFMQAALGEDRALWQVPAGAFTPGTPLATDLGMEAVAGPRDPEAAKRALAAAGYKGEPVVILSPTDSSSAPTVLELAAENNVPVVIADIGTDEGEYVSFVISTNEQGAYEAGQVLVERMQANGCEGGDIAMVTISQARLNGQNRTKGITRAIEEGGGEIVQFLQSEDYTRAEAQQQTSDLLSANPDICGFFTQHDEAALGALTAIEESGRAEDLAFASFDGSPESVELIRQGKLVAASMQQPVLMGRIAMEVGLQHLRGEEVERETSVPTILVTPENLADVEAQLGDTVFPAEGGAGTPTA